MGEDRITGNKRFGEIRSGFRELRDLGRLRRPKNIVSARKRSRKTHRNRVFPSVLVVKTRNFPPAAPAIEYTLHIYVVEREDLKSVRKVENQ